MQDERKTEIGQFYDKVGWQAEGDGHYQNAQYEDLRPVSAQYLERAHARVGRQLSKEGRYFLDAGSGPVQYEAYLRYSEGYEKRVCMDLSYQALKEAQTRLGDKGLYIVGDLCYPPFVREAFDGIMALHAIHHVPMEEKETAYRNLYRCLKPGHTMVTVDGWSEHGLKRFSDYCIALAKRLKRKAPLRAQDVEKTPTSEAPASIAPAKVEDPAGTFVAKNSAKWFKETFTGKIPFKILVWRSVSVRFLRAVIADNGLGRFALSLLYRLEECFPRFFGENGQYPLIVISKAAGNEAVAPKENV